jgi:hypothetical protein
MNEFSTLFVGLDVHKDSIVISVADAPRDAEIRHIGGIRDDLASLHKSIRRLISCGQPQHIVYEAGTCGFVIWRYRTADGVHCEVVAPSSMPRGSGAPAAASLLVRAAAGFVGQARSEGSWSACSQSPVVQTC